MKNKELIFRFQNPNSAEITVDFFLREMMRTNGKRMEELLMKKIKAVAVLTAVVLVAGAFAGCGKKQAKDDVTEITMWSGDTHSKAVMSELVNEFNQTIGKQNKVKFVYQIKEDAGNQLKVALQNGSEPDLFLAQDSVSIYKAGYAETLNEHLADSKYLTAQQVYSGALTADSEDGIFFAVPHFCSAKIVMGNTEYIPSGIGKLQTKNTTENLKTYLEAIK